MQDKLIQKTEEIAKQEIWQENWIPIAGEVVGRKHLRSGIPCQDACIAAIDPRPYIVACDGRGSADKSHFGANDAISSIKRQMTISASILQDLLDQEDNTNEEQLLPILKDQFFRAAAVVQKELAEKHASSPKDFEFTLIMMILGKKKGFYLHIGDGALVIEENGETMVLSSPANGEFANVTNFVQYGKEAKMQFGLVDVKRITALAAFSDGTGEKMIQSGTGLPSPGFTDIWKNMRNDEFARKDLLNLLTRPDWEPKVQDDRCLALLSRRTENNEVEVAITDVNDTQDKGAKDDEKSEVDEKVEISSNPNDFEEEPAETAELDKKKAGYPLNITGNIFENARKSLIEIGLLIVILICQLFILNYLTALKENAKSPDPELKTAPKNTTTEKTKDANTVPPVTETPVQPEASEDGLMKDKQEKPQSKESLNEEEPSQKNDNQPASNTSRETLISREEPHE